MPSAIPAGATNDLPPAGRIDPRGHRFGAGLSAILLVVAYLINAPWLVAVALASIGVSATFGLRYSIYGVIWRRIVKIAHLGPTEPEHEYPPRFAQTLGSVALIIGLVGFIGGAPIVGWGAAFAVAGLQTLLAATGYCLGCRLYFLRWWVPDLATRIWTRGRRGSALEAAVPRISYR